MTDFEATLRAKLARNAELAREREQAEVEMDRVLSDQRAAEQRAAAERAEAQKDRHAELVEHLKALVLQLKESSPETFIVRTGWTQSGEEFITKLSTRLLEPARSLFIELDRDDDEVLARWTSDLGNTIELWRLVEMTPQMLAELVVQVADQEAWRGRSAPPPFPGARA